MNPPANQRPQLVMKTVFFSLLPRSCSIHFGCAVCEIFQTAPDTGSLCALNALVSIPHTLEMEWKKRNVTVFFFFFFSFFRVWGTRASSSMNETGANGVADRSGLVSPMRNFANLCAIFFKNQKFNAAVSSSDSNVAFRSEKQTVTDIWYPHNPQSEPVERIPAVFFF